MKDAKRRFLKRIRKLQRNYRKSKIKRANKLHSSLMFAKSQWNFLKNIVIEVVIDWKNPKWPSRKNQNLKSNCIFMKISIEGIIWMAATNKSRKESRQPAERGHHSNKNIRLLSKPARATFSNMDLSMLPWATNQGTFREI